MKSKKRNHILLWVISIILAFAMNSCGARRTDKNRSSEITNAITTDKSVVVEKKDSNTKTEVKTTIDDKNKIKTVETIYKPIDPNKEASVTTPDGKKHKLNNAEFYTKETTQDNDTKTDKALNSEEANKSSVSESKDIKSKDTAKKKEEVINTDKKAYNIFNLLWLLIPALCIMFFYTRSTKVNFGGYNTEKKFEQ
jgi:type IV secretory pathway VirB10-like protein